MSVRFWCLPAGVLALAIVGTGLWAEEPACPTSCKPATCPAGGCTRTHSCTSTSCKDEKSGEGCNACEGCKPKCDSIHQRLAEPVSIDFKEKPFSELVSDLQLLSGIRIRLDDDALEKEGVNLACPTTLDVEHATLKCVLNILMKQAHLGYVVKDDHILITTEGRGQVQHVYPCAELPIEIIPVSAEEEEDD